MNNSEVKHTYWFGDSVFSHDIYPEELTFSELTDIIVCHPEVDIIRSEYQKLSKKGKLQHKNGKYIMAAGFNEEDSPIRDLKYATHINLITIDIDNSKDAKTFLESIKTGNIATLTNRNYIVYSTLSATVKAPRLRLIIDINSFPVADYSNVVQSIGKDIGLTKITTESKNPVQPMFFPKGFMK